MILLLALIAAYPLDVPCEKYGDGSPIAMSKCLGVQFTIWDQRLGLEYRAALKRAEIDDAKLRASQRAWLQYRAANCKAYGTVQGSISIVLAGNCWRDMTRLRTLELRDMTWVG